MAHRSTFPQLRLRIFAGPNGSGKSTVIGSVRKFKVDGRKIDFGVYINADDIAVRLSKKALNFNHYKVRTTPKEFITIAVNSGLINTHFTEATFRLSFRLRNNILTLNSPNHIELLAQAIAEFLRTKLLNDKKKFTFETVFSHPSKLDFMRQATEAGYKVYLYFVATESPEINVFRVQARTRKGGHDVPEEKIRSRYERSMNNLFEASLIADRTYFFDNSAGKKELKMVGQLRKPGLLPNVKISDPCPHWITKYFSVKYLEYIAALDS